MIRFTAYRDLLMDQHGWSRRVATMAARLYMGTDTPADLAAAQEGRYGRPLLSQTEYQQIVRVR